MAARNSHDTQIEQLATLIEESPTLIEESPLYFL